MSDDRIQQYILAASEDQAIADVGVYDDPCQVYCIGATVGVALVLSDWIESDKVKDARIASLQARYLQAINLMGAAVFDRGQSAQMLADMVDFFSNTPLDPGGLKNAMTGCDLLRNAKAIIKKVDAELEHNAEFERIQIAAKRYETLRTLNARQFADLCAENIESGVAFDELVDSIGKEGQAL